ncbi:MAG TPA: transcription termination/antitermination protein NusG [Candidatus Ornithospirochaeta avicola]|uniref:Transcription termination/antitermination protein NusG n=1 Tax=Candidatus Ornithospirochaeta avicola TaxID=2840896 RepID=A0A9D1PT54_9SPIO|nr:transcription termination/antitermination protein NusG [Candidatus Ornithospirochaeta avicola]
MAQGWYVVHTYSGHEQKIERVINKMRDNDPDFALYCTAVRVPMEEVRTLNDKGEEKTEMRKLLPGYILVELNLDDSNWKDITSRIARIAGVTGFITADKSGRVPPVPLTATEHKRILERTGEIAAEKTFRPKQDFEKGEEVIVTSGPFASFHGTVEEIDLAKGKLRLMLEILGRFTPVDVDFSQAEKIVK